MTVDKNPTDIFAIRATSRSRATSLIVTLLPDEVERQRAQSIRALLRLHFNRCISQCCTVLHFLSCSPILMGLPSCCRASS
ncbi:hypothetical protein CY34DRAFT_799753 [Suillus luteus UH-Slu-Lm8-n1]|uniref:Unplaced genomic scaffold CY34scaffold_20, whole genome shotgun sequence n=1 Tax=Suillus luteus UH-Slu-Lm8-n1 TaxID=930992 RepID=A0A0D0BMK2_9AGAM|nr:hypothetical protein CY34DRAFT_799753 [Suillus luteus UH-Slu-Lm8-n1]